MRHSSCLRNRRNELLFIESASIYSTQTTTEKLEICCLKFRVGEGGGGRGGGGGGGGEEEEEEEEEGEEEEKEEEGEEEEEEKEDGIQ